MGPIYTSVHAFKKVLKSNKCVRKGSYSCFTVFSKINKKTAIPCTFISGFGNIINKLQRGM